MPNALLNTDLPFPKRSGKVRDVYDTSALTATPTMLVIASDRISAFDCIMPNGIPGKGKVLTAISLFWFNWLRDRLGDDLKLHLISANVDDYPPELRPYRDQLEGRSMLVHKASVIPFECVARGYLAGSGWKDYQQTGGICGEPLPPGLQKASKLPSPIFTPATKAETGHDENVSYDCMAAELGQPLSSQLRDFTLRLYSDAAAYAQSRGVILADTKFEFGHLPDGSLALIDEVLTPDSSRYWPADTWQPGTEPASFDKQFVRNYLETLDWNKHPPAPPLPEEIVTATLQRYEEAARKLTAR